MAPHAENPVITVEGLGKLYRIYDQPIDRLKQIIVGTFIRHGYGREHWALKNVTFTVQRGESVGIIGRNGAGKSTLLQMISGTLNPTIGTCQTHGRVIGLLELGSGFNPEFSGRENIFLYGAILGLSQQEIENKFNEIVEFADIGNFLNQSIRSYSSGMVMRLAFSVVAHLNPEILIVDEALAVGDIFFQIKCMERLRSMSGITRLFVSHDLSAVSRLCERTIVLDGGRLVFDGPTAGGIELYLRLAHTSLFASPEKQDVVSDISKPAEGEISTWTAIANEQVGGSLKAVIKRVMITVNGHRQQNVSQGDLVQVHLLIESTLDIKQPIIGYLAKDRYGTNIFGENTVTSGIHLDAIRADTQTQVHFRFTWPDIRADEYALTFGLGDGPDALTHIIHCWAHNAISMVSLAGGRQFHAIINTPILAASVVPA